MKNIKSHFKFNKQERSGIFFLLLVIILLQIGYFAMRFYSQDKRISGLSVDTITQAKIDALKEKALQKDSVRIYPFNPNFITDYKGYTLGMSLEEIERLHTFRAGNEYVNSSKGFQKVTQVSDSLLQVISPYFKFPDWTKKKSDRSLIGSKRNSEKKSKSSSLKKNAEVVVSDLNSATAEDLKSINGIGEKLSARIVKFRDRLGGFLVNEQLVDVYGLEPEVMQRVLKKFKVFNQSEVEKININTATAYEISSLVYIKYGLAKEIVNYRALNGSFTSLNELVNIPDFPSEKIDRIALYLIL